MELNSPTTVAVAKAVKKVVLEQARSDLRPGEYDIDATLRLVGSIKVGEDSTYTPTTSLPLIGVLALVLRHCGVTRDAALAAVERIATEAIQDFEKVGEACSDAGEFMTEMTHKVTEMTQSLPKKPKCGVVTTKLQLSAVSSACTERVA